MSKNSHAQQPKPRPNYFSLPNNIFQQGLTPNEFIVYAFLVSARDKVEDTSYWSVSGIARNCHMCKNTCRKALHSLKDMGFVNIASRYLNGVQLSNLYTVIRDHFDD